MTNQIKYVTLTIDNFEAEVINNDIPVLVDFWAPWCGPCRVMNPIVATLAEEWDGKVKVGKANIDDTETLATKYGIQAAPTILIFQNGEIIDRLPGLVSQKALEAKLNDLTGSVSTV